MQLPCQINYNFTAQVRTRVFFVFCGLKSRGGHKVGPAFSGWPVFTRFCFYLKQRAGAVFQMLTRRQKTAALLRTKRGNDLPGQASFLSPGILFAILNFTRNLDISPTSPWSPVVTGLFFNLYSTAMKFLNQVVENFLHRKNILDFMHVDTGKYHALVGPSRVGIFQGFDDTVFPGAFF